MRPTVDDRTSWGAWAYMPRKRKNTMQLFIIRVLVLLLASPASAEGDEDSRMGDMVMLGRAIVLGLAAISLSGTVAAASLSGTAASVQTVDLRDQYYGNALGLRQLQQQRHQLEEQMPNQQPTSQESRFCQDSRFQGSDSTTLQTRRMLGCKDQQYQPNQPNQQPTSRESRFCQDSRFQGSDRITLQTRQMLGCSR